MLVNFKIKFSKINDQYTRFTGLAVDEPLDPKWYNVRPDQNLQMIGVTTEISKSIDLTEGIHTVEVGISAHPDTPWGVEIYADDVIINSGTSNWNVFVSGTINVGTITTSEGEEETVVTPAPAFKVVDKLRNIWQKIISHFQPDESIEAYR